MKPIAAASTRSVLSAILVLAVSYGAVAAVDQPGPESRVTAQAEASATLGGTVVDENGQPIADARVCVILKTWPGGRYRQESFAARTDKEGRYSWTDFYPLGRQSALLVTISHDGYALTSVYHLNKDGKELPDDAFQLPPAAPVTVQLSDAEGRAAAGVKVLVSARKTEDGIEHLLYSQSARQAPELLAGTDDEGRVTLRQFLPGDQARLSVIVDGDEQRLDFEVPEKGEVKLVLGAPAERPGRSVPLKDLPPPDRDHVAWVARHAIELKSIDPQHTDFADLQPLKALIGDARIVLLGEQSHGDGAVFHTKTRLIKFLHQEMGFDVLAFESGLYDCRSAWRAFQAGRPPREAAEQGIFGIWTMSREVQPLLQYLASQAATDNPLELAGFDDQMTARASREHLVDDVREVLAGIPIEAINAETRSTILKSLQMLSEQEPLGERREAFRTACETVREALLQVPAGELDANLDRAFWAQFFRSIRVYADHTQDRGLNPGTLNLRDRQMAENLAWLAKVQYADRKIIAWAASRHNMANPQIIRAQDGKLFYDGVTALGHELRSLVDPQEIFSIGFTAWEGEAGPWFQRPHEIPRARTGSLEDLLQRTGKDNLILPLRDLGEDGRWLAAPLESRPLGYSPMTADWTQVFDAMVFNRTMTPSTRVLGQE